MKRDKRLNGIAAAQKVALLRKREKYGYLAGSAVGALVSILLFKEHGWQGAAIGFAACFLVAQMLFSILFKPKCPFCGVSLTQNRELEIGTLHLPKCIKCGVPFEMLNGK
ncbi:hypothetical protein [Rhodoferax mekongensis]|uniref:Uncharacterized protein n=1 Tax=Rhodoferax mekongensis TaxID=3068341 RepID=A0ABZ0B0K5_9BURK|nr:hypothetical protein [Rhodoferax sp. TBRC 17307]WNO05366.1 hypothetical protein RAN89_02755 [Rhodoferax sp. TBRC 17307]